MFKPILSTDIFSLLKSMKLYYQIKGFISQPHFQFGPFQRPQHISLNKLLSLLHHFCYPDLLVCVYVYLVFLSLYHQAVLILHFNKSDNFLLWDCFNADTALDIINQPASLGLERVQLWTASPSKRELSDVSSSTPVLGMLKQDFDCCLCWCLDVSSFFHWCWFWNVLAPVRLAILLWGWRMFAMMSLQLFANS